MAENPKLVVLSEKLRGKTFTLEADKISVGRNDQRDICIKDPSVSSYHCDLTREGENYVLTDNNSTNGSRVNNVPVTTRQALKNSDIIQLGSIELLYDYSSAAGFTAASRTQTGIEIGNSDTSLDTVPNFQNLNPYANEDRIRDQKNHRILVVALAVLGLLLILLLILFIAKMR